MAYRMTPARKLALKKAQAISARRRKGTGKKKASSGGKRSVAAVKAQNVRRRRNVKRTAGAVAAVGAVAGAAYVYKNRERMIIAPQAERMAVRIATRKAGRKLSKTETHRVRKTERINHANRSTYRVREYLSARQTYVKVAKKGYTLKPGSKNTIWGIVPDSPDKSVQDYIYGTYRKDVNARATHRLNKIKGKKTTGFSYKSGKVKAVIGGRVYRMPF